MQGGDAPLPPSQATRPRSYYERLLLWLITPHDSMHTKGFLAMWRAYTTKEKAILLELIHLALFQARRHITVKSQLHHRYIAATSPLPHRYIYRYILVELIHLRPLPGRPSPEPSPP